MVWTLTDIPDLSGRTAVVTGANGGLGLETARELARKNASVVIAARNLDKARKAIASIESDVTDPDLEIVHLDLASIASVVEAAEAITSRHNVIDILVNNAGVMATPRNETADGFEMQLGTNHLGHFVFTRYMLPTVARSRNGRIITVTSVARHIGLPPNPDNPHLHGNYNPWRAYGTSKLANLYFAVELHRRLHPGGAPTDDNAPTASLAAHPGVTYTDLQTTSVRASGGNLTQKSFAWLARTTGMSTTFGAQSQLRAATDPSALSGEMYAPRWATVGPPVRRRLFGRSLSAKAGASLWNLSERETGVEFDVASLVARA